MYDVTCQNSFNNIKNWIFQIRETVDNKVCILLVGNKIDDKENRRISTEQGEELAKEFEINFIESSAKMDINVAKTFTDIANNIYTSFFEYSMVPEKDIKLGEGGKEVKKKNDCCLRN